MTPVEYADVAVKIAAAGIPPETHARPRIQKTETAREESALSKNPVRTMELLSGGEVEEPSHQVMGTENSMAARKAFYRMP
jgi:hypothetical protein